jgi:transcriptional regulator with XRE-family HTH domain
MNTLGTRINRLRRHLGETQAEFGSRFGVDQSTISKWESGKQVPESGHLDIVGSLESAEGETVPFGTIPTTGGNPLFTLVPIVGYAGAGAVVQMYDRGAGSSAIEYIKAPKGFGAVEAIEVRGDSMYPVYRNGDTIYFDGREAALPITESDEYVVELRDGRMLLKIVEPRGNGKYTLLAYNGAPVNGVEVVRAFKVRYIRRR